MLFSLCFTYLFIAATAQSLDSGNDLARDVAFLFTEATAGTGA